MLIPRYFSATLTAFAAWAACLVLAQDADFHKQKKKKDKGHDEDAKMAKLLEKAFKKAKDDGKQKGIDLFHEAEKLFRHMDRDGDGLLDVEELPQGLRDELSRWDLNRDQRIEPSEYATYFMQRFQRLRQEVEAMPSRPPAAGVEWHEDERPRVFRAGRLPTGLPPWFAELDADRDGQVALYEWRRQRARPSVELLAEFRAMDHNDDGFISPAEMLRLLQQQSKDERKPSR